MKSDSAKNRTPILDTYTVTAEECPEWPNVRRFIFPIEKKIIINLSALDGKIDKIIRTDGGYIG